MRRCGSPPARRDLSAESAPCGIPRVEQLPAIAHYAFLDREERRRVARAAQRADVGLGEILVLAFQRVRERRVFDHALRARLIEAQGLFALRPAAGVDRGEGYVVEALRAARADVEDARDLRVVEKVKVDLDHVLDRNEIAALLPVGVAARAGKRAHAPLRCILIEEVPSHGSHTALVPLVGAVHVEVAEPGDLRARFGEPPAHRLIEQELRVAVDVERRREPALLAKAGARPVDRRRGRVDQGHFILQAEIEQRHRIAVVLLHHEAAVGPQGVGARALMEHRVDRAREIPRREARAEFVLVQKIGDLAGRQIAELVAVLQIVHGEDLRFAAGVERAHQVRAYEAGGAGDYVVHVYLCPSASRSSSGWTGTAPSLPTLIPAARLATTTASCNGMPAPSITPRVAMTVSPAPLRSNTSRARARSCRTLPAS